jgi:hypothetical protein
MVLTGQMTHYLGTNTTNSRRIDSLSQWNFGLACDQNVTIKEKMTWFWYHFIPVDFEPCVVHHFHMRAVIHVAYCTPT